RRQCHPLSRLRWRVPRGRVGALLLLLAVCHQPKPKPKHPSPPLPLAFGQREGADCCGLQSTGQLWPAPGRIPLMTIASWNVNSLNVRLPHLEQWLADFAPDVVGIQETKLEDHKFPDTRLLELGYRNVFAGQKTYNGVALLARDPIEDVQIGIPGFEDEQKR